MESLHIANLLDEKGKTLLKEIFPKKIREELKNSRKIDDTSGAFLLCAGQT